MRVSRRTVPLLPGALEYARRGVLPGGLGRNRDYLLGAGAVRLAEGLEDAHAQLLFDPQTSGGLLVSCSPDTVTEVLSIFLQQGFSHVSVIGEVLKGKPSIEVI